ncbi:MAG: aldehyde dehydrogenase [endosymbiont of Galathealinum brachiosum]|uniref:Aldehyde dehydrogenase n=1 Tax=endosymbiont of Galathealinum brachiosum TaxID=2200906 RepID=A0A370DA01_9GAMM|nr:MAG: aldehyde dehydrogenase [endosymbiont of Galathealinum brachiosum]
MITGNIKASGKLDVTAPYDGQLIATVDKVDKNAIDHALNIASDLYNDRSKWLSADKRIEILTRLSALMEDNAERLILISAQEGGKPLNDTKVEMARAIDGINNCIECIRNNHGEEIPMGLNAASMNRLAFTSHEPIGVVVAVSAFNHPINLIVHQVGPAVASGCPVIIKPADDTPLSCYELVKLFHQAGLPEEWAQVVSPESHDVAEALVTDSRVGFFSFIGSARVGWMLRSKLAPGARCALEHGGVAPVIVAADADLQSALPMLAKGGFYHAGQVCVSVQRVFVEKAIARQVAEKIAELGNKMTVGDPTSADTDIGPIIRHSETNRINEWVEEAINAGAERISGSGKISDSCYSPTVLFNPPENTSVTCKEIFGPVICVYEYEDIDEAIKRANSLDVSFQAAVYTSNLDTAMHAYKQLNASAVMVNDFTAFRVDWMPFAGLRQSGMGVGGIPHTFKDMQIEKMIVIKSGKL